MKRSKVLLWIVVLIFAVLSIGTLSACGKEYTVTFDANGGFFVSGELSQTVKSPSEIAAPTFGKLGYKMSWDTDIKSIKRDTTVKAVWTAVEYSITYDLDSGSWGGVNDYPKQYTVESDEIVILNPVKYGYNFIGWTGGGNESPVKDLTIPTGSYGNKLYTAHWEVAVYSITYDFNGGEQSDPMPATYKTTDTSYTISNPTREGYDFVGWTGTGIVSPVKDLTIPTGSYGNKSYIANWTPLKFSLSFDLNGGTVDGNTAIDPKDVFYDTQVGSLPIPDIDDKIFAGWYYDDTQIKSASIFKKLEDITITAKFVDTYTIKFVLLSPFGGSEIQCYYNGEKDKADEEVDVNGTLSELVDAVPSGGDSTGIVFDKWVYVMENGEEMEITKDTVFSKDKFTEQTIYVIAKCKKDSSYIPVE